MNDPNETEGAAATDRYLSGGYLTAHADWHLEDAPGKALDIGPSIDAVIDALGKGSLRIADVGAGVGGVLHETRKRLAKERPEIEVETVGFEISEQAVERGHALHPDVELRNQFFDASVGEFDVVTFNDVLEHLENPWEMLRNAAVVAPFMVVRQPLLEGFSIFRHDLYRFQQDHYGHIAYFNVHSFQQLTAATGWEPIGDGLTPPWDLHTGKANKGRFASTLDKIDRRWASFFCSGYYQVGAYRRRDAER